MCYAVGMKHCRTCKYWSLSADEIGRGWCTNVDVNLKVGDHSGMFTSQNFGCVNHETGPCGAEIFIRNDQVQMLREFVLDRYTLLLK